MAWPTTPATTTHLDAGTDDPNLARPQIKQNVDNVNAIIDEFGDVSITTPSDGEVLTYVSANSRWENATGGGGSGVAGTTAYYNCTYVPTVSTEYFGFTELSDPGSIATLGGTNNIYFTPSSGTYIVDITGMRDNTNASVSIVVRWRNFTTSTTVETNRAGYEGASLAVSFTANGTDQFGLQLGTASTAFQDGFILKLIKIS